MWKIDQEFQNNQVKTESKPVMKGFLLW
jgi:hypothetical protein